MPEILGAPVILRQSLLLPSLKHLCQLVGELLSSDILCENPAGLAVDDEYGRYGVDIEHILYALLVYTVRPCQVLSGDSFSPCAVVLVDRDGYNLKPFAAESLVYRDCRLIQRN